MQASFATQASSLANDGVLSAQSLYMTAVGQTAAASPADDMQIMVSFVILFLCA